MSYQQVESVISSYFSELLSIQDSPLEDVIEQMESSSASTQPAINTEETSTAIELEKENSKVLSARQPESFLNNETPISASAKEIVSQEKTHVKQENKNEEINQDHLNTNEVMSTQLHDSQSSETTLAQSMTVAKTTTQQDDRPLPLKEETPKLEPALAKETNGVLKIDADPAIETAAYEQHKQRLEKMLEQVSSLDTNLESSIGLDTQTLEKNKAISAVLTEQNLAQIEEDYVDILPPLSSEWLDNGRPNWAQERFDILLIEVNGLKLAVPLIALGQIQDLDEDLTPLFGQSEWFMGLQKSPMGNIKTVNTAKFVMPERYQDEHDYKFVVSINGLKWGLAVDRIHQPISVDPDTIRWRTNRSSRPWMAGMVKDHMCVLMDIPSMGEILQSQDKNHQ